MNIYPFSALRASASLLVTILTACSAKPTPTAEPTATPTPTLIPFDREAETYQVYLSVIDMRCHLSKGIILDPDTPSKGYYWYSTTWSNFDAQASYEWLDSEFRLPRAEIPTSLERSTFDDYIRDYLEDPFVLDKDYDFGRPTLFMSLNKFNEVIAAVGDDTFLQTYPKNCGYVSLSRVGFNDTGNQALVYLEAYGIGWSCIEEHVLLVKQGVDWKIAGESVNSIC